MFGKRSSVSQSPARSAPARPPEAKAPQLKPAPKSPEPKAAESTVSEAKLSAAAQEKESARRHSEDYYDVKTTVFNALIDTIDLTHSPSWMLLRLARKFATSSARLSRSRMS